MAVLLGYRSDIVLNIADVVVTCRFVQGVDDDYLLAVLLHSMACEHHDDEEVLLGGILDSLLEVGSGGIDNFLV